MPAAVGLRGTIRRTRRPRARRCWEPEASVATAEAPAAWRVTRAGATPKDAAASEAEAAVAWPVEEAVVSPVSLITFHRRTKKNKTRARARPKSIRPRNDGGTFNRLSAGTIRFSVKFR